MTTTHLGLRLTGAFVITWMAPACLAALVWLATITTRSSSPLGLRIALRTLIVAYFLAAIALNLWPFHFDASLLRVVRRGNFTPLGGSLRFLVTERALVSYLRDRDSLHVVLLAPIGMLLPLQQLRRLRLSTFVAWATLLVGLAAALEIVQGVSVLGREFDVDDAIAGAAGAFLAVLGGAVFRVMVDAWKRASARRRPSSA